MSITEKRSSSRKARAVLRLAVLGAIWSLASCQGVDWATPSEPAVATAELVPTEVVQLDFNFPARGEDAELRQSTPNVNVGTGTQLNLQGGVTEVAIRFGVSAVQAEVPAGTPILWARMEIHSAMPFGAYEARRAQAPWTQAAATWNCPIDGNLGDPGANCATGWGATRASAVVATADAAAIVGGTGWLSFDVTEDVRAMLASTSATHEGFLLAPVGVATGIFESREWVADPLLRPRLVIQPASGGFAPTEPSTNPADPTYPPRLDRSTPTHVYDAMSWLLDGAHNLQWASIGAISRERAGLLRGQVLDRDSGDPIAGVEVTVVGHPEFGRTRTRLSADGLSSTGNFELLVNGGGPVVLRFRRDASTGYSGAEYLDVYRTVDVAWNSWNHVSDVSMVPRGRVDCQTMASGLFLADVTDPLDSPRGQRQLGLYVPGSTAVSSNGAVVAGTKTWCLAEHTLEPDGGSGGPQSMGATLPDSTDYTFAFEAEVHSGSTGTSAATRIADPSFSQPVFGYLLTNPNPANPFVNLAVGTSVPVGTYDEAAGQWVPGPDGVVLEVINDDAVDCTTASFPLPHDESLAICAHAAFQVGRRFWRVPQTHFSDPDWNFNTGATGEDPEPAVTPPDQTDCETPSTGSIIHCESGILGEAVSLTGTPYSLMYSSGRQRGRYEEYRVRFTPLANAGAMEPSPDRILAQLVVANTTVPIAPLPPVEYTGLQMTTEQSLLWDGNDGYGRSLIGPQVAYLRLGYRWDLLTYRTTPGARGFGGPEDPNVTVEVTATGTTGAQVTVWRTVRVVVGTIDDRISGLGGWGIDAHHYYDPATSVLYLGDGTRRTGETVGSMTSLLESNPDARSVVVSPVGDIYFWSATGGHIHVRRRGASSSVQLGTDSYVNVVAMGFGRAPVRWSGSAVSQDVLVVADAGDHVVWAVRPTDGVRVRLVGVQTVWSPETVLGVGDVSTTPTVDFYLDAPNGVAVASDGSILILDGNHHRLLRYRDDGFETTVSLALDLEGYSLDDGLAIGPDDAVYFSSFQNPVHRIESLRSDGQRDLVAGGGDSVVDGALANCDGVDPEFCATVDATQGIAVSAADQVCWLEIAHAGTSPRVRCIFGDGRVYTVAGARWQDVEPGTPSFSDDAQRFLAPIAGSRTPSTRTLVGTASGLAASPDGTLYYVDTQASGGLSSRICAVSPTLDGSLLNTHVIASDDGRQLYEFTAAGRHTRTLDALTQTQLVSFTYDTAAATLGRLLAINDHDGTSVAIAYPSSTQITLTAPGALVTTLNLGPSGSAAGLATTIVQPRTTSSNRTWTMTYDNTMPVPQLGLLRTLDDPRGAGITAYDFTYSPTTGRLTRDEDLDDTLAALGPFQDLSAPASVDVSGVIWRQTVLTAPADSLEGSSFTTAARERHFMTRRTETGVAQRRVERGTGAFVEATVPADGREITTTSSIGDTSVVHLSPHPRWGMAAPLVGRQEVTQDRTCPEDPMASECVGTWAHASTYTSGTQTYADTYTTTPSPTLSGSAEWTRTLAPSMGGWLLTIMPPTDSVLPDLTARFDSRGRLIRMDLPGQYPVCVAYAGTSGRITSIIRAPSLTATTCDGASTARRQVTLSYPTDQTRWASGVTTGYGTWTLATAIYRDRRGTIDLIDLPARRAYDMVNPQTADIDIGFDEIGNMTSFRPARLGSTNHSTFTYTSTPRSSLSSFTPPLVGAEIVSTTYRPDGRMRTRTFAGTTARTITVAANPATGYVSSTVTADAVLSAAIPAAEMFPSAESYVVNSRDTSGRVIMETGPGGSLTDQYAGAARTRVTWAANGIAGVAGVLASTISGSGLLVSERACFGPSCATSGGRTMTYVRTSDGLVSSITSPMATTTSVAYTFSTGSSPSISRTTTSGSMVGLEGSTATEAFGIRSLTWQPTGTQPYSNIYCGVDSLGRITGRIEVTRASGQTGATASYAYHSYTYDTAGRVLAYQQRTSATAINCVSGPMATLVVNHTNLYDDQGNRTSPTISADMNDRATVGGRFYDSVGRLRARTDAGGARTLAYDLFGRLRSTTLGSVTARYDYDPAGRLVSVRPGASGGTGVVPQRFLYRDGLNPIAWQRTSEASSSCGAGAMDTWYFVYATNPQAPDLAYVDLCSDGSLNRTLRYALDDRGSVRALFDITDPVVAGKRLIEITYDEWGVPTYTGSSSTTGSPAISATSARTYQPFGFAGAIWLESPSLWHMGARDYDPAVAQWTARDPMHFAGGMNLYTYCHNDPVNRTDVTGLRDYSAAETQQLLEEVLQRYRERAAGNGDPMVGLGGPSLGYDMWDYLMSYCDLLLLMARNHDGSSRTGDPDSNYDFRWSHANDTWIVNGVQLDAGEFGNYFAGYTVGGALGPLGELAVLEAGEYYSQHEYGIPDDPHDQELIRSGAADARRLHPELASTGCNCL